MLPRLPVHDAQLPASGTLTLDHVAHFVPDRDAAADALARLGFTTTPFSEQSHRTGPDAPVEPAGTGNRCVMLERGYLEFLTPFADTPIAEQLRVAIRRYTGVHLVAYGSADAETDHRRLEAEGFAPPDPVRLQREVSTGEDDVGATPAISGRAAAADAGVGPRSMTVRFTVTRTAPGCMPEGRIQFCQHHSPEGVWQTRWLAHRNALRALTGVHLCVADPEEAAHRYARYAGIAVQALPGGAGRGYVQTTARGRLVLCDAARLAALLGIEPPALPWIGAAELASADPGRTASVLREAGLMPVPLPDGRARVDLPAALGGAFVIDHR
jgi:hypothetical protein